MRFKVGCPACHSAAIFDTNKELNAKAIMLTATIGVNIDGGDVDLHRFICKSCGNEFWKITDLNVKAEIRKLYPVLCARRVD